MLGLYITRHLAITITVLLATWIPCKNPEDASRLGSGRIHQSYLSSLKSLDASCLRDSLFLGALYSTDAVFNTPQPCTITPPVCDGPPPPINLTETTCPAPYYELDFVDLDLHSGSSLAIPHRLFSTPSFMFCTRITTISLMMILSIWLPVLASDHRPQAFLFLCKTMLLVDYPQSRSRCADMPRNRTRRKVSRRFKYPKPPPPPPLPKRYPRAPSVLLSEKTSADEKLISNSLNLECNDSTRRDSTCIGLSDSRRAPVLKLKIEAPPIGCTLGITSTALKSGSPLDLRDGNTAPSSNISYITSCTTPFESNPFDLAHLPSQQTNYNWTVASGSSDNASMISDSTDSDGLASPITPVFYAFSTPRGSMRLKDPKPGISLRIFSLDRARDPYILPPD